MPPVTMGTASACSSSRMIGTAKSLSLSSIRQCVGLNHLQATNRRNETPLLVDGVRLPARRLCFAGHFVPAVTNCIFHLFPGALGIAPPVFRSKIRLDFVVRSTLVTRIRSHFVPIS